MNKYIDAEKLIHDLTERIFAYSEGYARGDDYRKDAIETLLKDIKYQCSLQQEQPEVDLEEEVKKYFDGLWPGIETVEQCNTDMHFTPLAIMRLINHFYELGKRLCAK